MYVKNTSLKVQGFDISITKLHIAAHIYDGKYVLKWSTAFLKLFLSIKNNNFCFLTFKHSEILEINPTTYFCVMFCFWKTRGNHIFQQKCFADNIFRFIYVGMQQALLSKRLMAYEKHTKKLNSILFILFVSSESIYSVYQVYRICVKWCRVWVKEIMSPN